jgi:small conductance mechanosensitive channel
MPEDLVAQANTFFTAYVVPFGWKIMGAIAVWIVGSWIVKFVAAAFGRMLVARKVDPTLGRYLEASAVVLMKILVLIAVFGVLGIETTSFAALIAAVGIAIGAAWAGLLSNFAAGIFLMTLRPFKVGDVITVAGVTGDVREIGLFVTALDTADNVRIYVGNAKIFADTIHNYSTNPHRRVDLKAQLAHGVNPYDAIKRLEAKLAVIRTCSRRRRRACRSSTSIRSARCSPCGRTATTTTTGRCSSTRTGRSTTSAARRGTPRLKREWRCGTRSAPGPRRATRPLAAPGRSAR